MAEDKVTNLYNAFVKNGYAMEPEAQFRENLKDPKKRKAAYDALVADGYNMEPFADFESNIGFGAPTPAPAPTAPTPQQQAQPAATAAPTSVPASATAEEQEQAPVQSQPEQAAWQPSEQEKIRMSYQMHTMLNDFKQKSKARIEQVQRMTEPLTPEGRKKLKAAKFQAQLAGTPTKVMGLTPPTPAPATEGAEGAAEGEAQQQPVQSGQSPVPYGVKYIDGKAVTQWLLPDGRLTTNYLEADQAEYGARTARLRHQFENRMKQNGLDPAKPEDVEMQAQFDAQAPAYSVVADLWREAEEKHKADKERNANKHWNSYASMGGGREMRVVTTSMNRHADNISHMTRFDLETMMDNAWNRVGSQITANCYNRLRQQYPGASEEELQATASQMARSLSDNAVYQYAVQQNTPKSTLEYFGRTVADMNVVNSISKGLARSQAGTSGDLAAYEAAMGEYGKNHRVAQVAGTVAGMAVDPVTWVSGGVGSLAGKGALNLGGRFLASRAAGMTAQMSSRLFGSSLTGRIIVGSAGAAGNLATYEGLKEAESQWLHGGHVNAETGEVEGYSAGEILKSTGHGMLMGSVIGPLSPVIGNVGDKAVRATTSTIGKVGVRGGEIVVSTLAEGTIFSVPQWISGEGDAFDVWTDNMAMMLGFKAQHGIKSAPRVIASLRPIKPTNGRPLTQAERNHNRMDFEERLRKSMDASPNDLAFTADEREELRRAGYGELADLFSRDRVQEVQRPKINPAEGAIELRAERVEAETVHRGPEFDGYSAMEELMQDGRVSQAARAKAYYILTGRMLPMGTVTGYTTTTTEDGRVTISATTADGEIVTTRTFKNEQESKQEVDNIMRQAELNSIDVGERYKEAVADDMVLDAAISEVSPGADPATIKKIYRAVKAGNKDVTESQVQLVEFLDDAIGRNKEIADKYRPEAIRAELMNETGIDVDVVLRKMPGKRTEVEQAAVKSYLERLFPEEARQQNADPTPEQAEAQNRYEQGRLLYGRFEEGDPTVQADVDAIALRMQEAYQAVEDAFGAEAEYYMFHVNENPWALVNDPELTAEQQDAVLYYINAKAALDGVMDASNEAADRKRAEVEQSVDKRTHKDKDGKDDGMIISAETKMGKQVYIVMGDVVMFPDNKGVDRQNSSSQIWVLNPESGEYEPSAPEFIERVIETVSVQDELDTALSVIEQEQMNIFGENAVAPEEATESEAEPEYIDPFARSAEAEAPATTDTEEYDRGYEEGIEVSTSLSDEVLNQTITDLRGRDFLTEEWRGRLEAYEYEQQRRQMEAQNAPAETTGNNGTENIPAPEQQAGTALSRIPLDEETQEPRFTAVDPETAWDGLVEAMEGEANALPIAQQMIEDANKRLEALGKKPPTPVKPKLAGKAGPMAMRAEQKRVDEANAKAQSEYQQALADAQAEAQAWSNILRVYTSRNAELRRQQEEERRQRDAIAHDEAVARFEEEQRIKAEKQAEQERIGVHAVNPKIRERWESAPKVEGNEDALTLPDGSTISGRYILTEAGAASPSHDVNNAYAPTEGFPIDENGQSVNDRDYQRDKDAQQKVEGMAGNYDNRALQDPVIVSKDGVVLSGNNRTMSGDLAARQGTDRAYNDYLAQFGHKKYGFTPEQVASMKNPRVVFVPDEALPYDATTFARFNAQEKKSQGKPEAAVKLGKIVPYNVFTSIVNDISRYDRLSDYYADEKAIAHALGALMQAGVINDMQMPEMRTGTALSAAGKELIENTLIGKVFQTSPDAVRQIISMPTLRQSIVMGLNEIANNRTLARNGYDISEELAKAVDLVTRAKAAMPDVYTDGMPVSPFGRMQGLFDDEFGDSRVADATALLLADILNSGKPSDLRKVLTSYNNEAAQASGGQLDMFSGSIPSKEEILTNVNEHFRNATPKEQQALVEAAIAERKRRAEAEQLGRDQESEQTPNDVERSAEPQQPVAGTREELTPEEQALAARVEITENDWEEGDSDKPTYKREIIIDGTHIVTQVDAPNEDGHYTGSYFEFDGKRFGDIAEIAQYIDGHPSAELKVDGGMQSEPTEAQKAAGNYKMEHRKVDGYNVSIENAKGSVRRGTGADGKSWETTMQNDYGYIRGTQGVDGDHIDVFLSDTPEEGDVFVVDQVNEDGSFDEHKVMYGFPTEQAARDAYLSNYEQGWTGLGAITHVSKEEFKKWIGSSKRKTKPFANYKSVKPKEDNSMVGRSLSEQEVTDLIAKMEANAEVAPAIELTPENWIAQFGEDGTVKTPIGIVKMGANQLLKLYSLKRTEYFGMIHPTLNSPDVILEEADPKEGSERDSKYLFIKTFVKSDGTRIVHFESVTVKKDGMEVSISSHEIKDKSLKNKMQNDIVLHLDEKLSPSSEMRLTETPSESEGPDLVPTSDNVSSDGKDNTLSADKQTDGAESSEPYTITPTTYTNKKGKTSDVHLVKFNRELTKEEKSALDTFVREPLAEGKKTSRGWYDRKQDGYMMRSEEAARQLGEMLGNEEAVADVQPMTAEELREAVGASRTRNPKPKKSPINRVSLEDVMTDLSTKGETKLSDHAEPVKAEQEAQHEISDDEMQWLANELRELLGIGEDEGDADIKFRDPGELTPQERQRIQSAGIRLAMGLVERGTTSFPDYATKMVGLLGDKIRPWLKSFYEGARWTPGYEKYAFTPTEQVAVFDVQNFDKKQADPIAQAAMIVEERKAATASEQAQKELIETRNKNRRENDKQREADTAALAEKAEAVAGEAESIAETSADAGELNRASELIDQTLDEVNDQLAVLGYYEAVEDDSKFHESYGYMLTAEKKAVADATKLAKQLVNDLGIDIKVTSATTPLGRKSVKKGTAVRANIAPAGGDVIVNLPLNEGRILAIYIGLEPVAEKGSRRQGDNLAVERILYRVENPNGKGMERYGHNMYAPVESTYADFLRRVKEITRDYLPKEKSVDELWQEWSDMAERGESPYTITPEVEAQLAEERKVDVTHNGYKVGDEVMWDRYGNGNWEKVKIEDFDTDGGPIFEAVKGVMSEKGDWSRVKPADGIFGEAQRVARATQEKKRSSRKKDVTLKPEQPVGDLFGGLFDNTQNLSNHEETEMGTRPGEAGGQRQQFKQDTQVGGDEPRRETERPAGEAGSGSTGMDSDADRAGSRGLHDVATQPALERLPEKERKNVHNNHVERGTEVAPKSESARIKANIAAIETMKKLEASGEAPTAADMKKLRAFSGWGGLGKAFSDWDTSRQLRQLLGDKLYDEGAEMSRNSAYFTPAYIVDAMWDIARAMGFKGGRVLEGSAGIGNVLGLMPQDLSERSYIRAVEKDPTTGKMLSLLYPDAVVDIDGFEKVKIETGTYDLVITNVPFVPGLKVADTSGDGDISKEFKTSIHDFCIAKNVRKLRDGGVGVFITTAGSMDGTGRLHKWLSNRENADIVGMFRMHNETFGGTNATSDIIVVRKRVNGVKSPNAIDCSLTTGVRTAEYDTGEKKKVKNVGEVPIIKTLSMSYNRYYVEHPEYMAGEMHFGFEKGDTSFRPESKGLYPIKEKDQSQLLSQWVEDMKQKLADTSEEPAPTVMNHRDEYVPTYDKVGNEVKTGTVVVDSQGRICVNYDGTARPLMSKLDNKNPKSADERIAQFNKNKVKGRSRVQVVQDYNAIKKALNDLLEYQKTSDSDEGLQPKLKALNRAFDSFVATYGHLHGNNGLAWLKNDVDYPSVIALETYREEGLEHKKVFGKADIFSRRVVVRPEQPKATNVRDGVTLSIRQTGSLDTRYIAEQLGMSEADVRREVIEAGLGYENPLTHSMEAAHEYLSGNVREKMQQAEVNNEDGRYTPNITALRKVVPHNIPSHFIEFSIGSSWLRPELFEQYVKERTGASVKLTYAGGMWAMDKPKWTGEQDKSFGIRSEICDKIITGTELIEAAMTNRTIRVSKQQKDGPTISDPKATSACAAKVDEIRDDFKSWLRSRMESAPELAKEIEETYNNIFNNSAPMTIPDEYIPEYFDGAARVIGGKPIKMRKHQSKAIVRGTMQSLMLAHEVGTGKTFTLITTAMEMRRLGTAKKPMIVVQNATLGQFVASAKALYPDARILSLEDKDRNAEGRKDFYAKIRYNDWDMVVIPQSVLERIPDHPDRERRFIEESIQEKMDVIEAMSKDREAGRAVAALKKDVENLRDQLNKLSDTETAEGEVTERVMVTSGSKPKKDGKRAAIAKENAKTRAEEMLNRATDDTLNFDDLGVDAILVDEAHEYKHLGFATAMQRGVKGVDPSYSKKCQGLYLKVKAVQEKSGGRNVIFATGTPISNTAAEVWTFMRYLLPREVMEGHNIWHFDDFVRNFGSIQQMLEFTTQGTYKENNRFAGYSNLPELARIWAGITDTVLTAEAGEVKSQIPELEGGQPTDLYLPQTNGLRAVLKFVRAQLKAYDEMSGQEKKENSHIPLVMYGIAKAAAIDARLVMANAPDDPHSKTNEAVRQTLRSLEDSKAYNGTVAIFADNYQRKNKGTGAVEFNLFDDIRTKLIAQGVPAEQVVIMRDGMTDKAKEKIFAKVNAGEIRVILGTTQRLGVGVNIQERLHTLMHIDAPNRPMDYWQRMGRLLRQGNMHKEMGIPVRVIRFGVEDSLDVTAYQRLKTKGAIADAIMHSKDLLANNLENRILEEEGDEFGNITAELSGSQYAMLQNQTEKELRKLQAKQDQHRQHQMYIHRAEPRLREQIEKFGNDIMRSNEILALLENNPTTITINGKTYQSREDMQKVFEAHNKAMAAKKQSVQQDEPITSTLTFDIGNVHFTLTTHVSQIAGYGGQGALSFDVDVQHDVVSHDIDYKRSFGDIPLKRIINELVDSVTSGKEERSNREAWVNAKERNETDLAALLKDKGKPFEHGERIKELEQKLEEYTIAMQEELKEKEAKYAEMDANIEDATDITFTSEDDEDSEDTPTNGDGNKYREDDDIDYSTLSDSNPMAMEARISELSKKVHIPVRIIRSLEELNEITSHRKRNAKGWWSAKDNEVVIVLPNNVNVADVDNTFVHEVAGHKGLRAFIGEERFNEFLTEVYNHASNPIRKVIDKKTDDMVNAEADRLRVRKAQARERAGEDVNSSYYADMAEARVEAEKKREDFRKEATEEYMSDLGGRIGSEGFEKISRDELTLWGKIKAKVQSFLDKFLHGLKIAKSIRLNDKDISYILFKSWKNMREKQGKGGVFADAEDAVMRRRTGYDADDVTRFRDPGLGLEETITKMKAEALQANTDNLQAKRDAMRAIGGNLNHLRQAMARQREYDLTTVKSISDLAKTMLDAGLLDDLSKYETKRILGTINNVVGKQDVSRYVQKVMDIMVDNQLRMGANTLGRLLSIRGSHVDARGIEVQGELDPDGQRIAQVVRKATSLPKDNIDIRIAEAINRMSSTDQAIADDATIEYAGLQIARQYVEDITESKAEEKALRDSIKQAKEDKDAGQMTEDAYRQYVASTEDAIRQNKIERAEAFHSLVEQVGGVLNESVERAKAWREAEKQRVEEIHHNANSDMEGRPTDEHHKDDRTQKLANNSGVRFLLAPLATFDQMLRMFGKKNTRGEGYLWNRYMRGWVSATEKEYTGYRDALKVLDAKVSEIYGKDMKWGDLFSIDRKLPKASVRFFDGGEMKDHELTQGNLLYIYMADKMSDGRMKLRRMGITEEDIEDIKNFLDPKFIQLADWMQEEFLVDKRNEYNEVHKRMFGASMAAIENYFPLKILANARLENVDVADDTTDTALPATSTGSIIKRRRNNLALDVTGANAFSVILDHLQQMERWAAFAEFNRDLNTLLSYKRFRNQVMNMSSVYGGGRTLWNNVRNVCRMAAGAYRPPIAALDKSAVNIAKGVTAAKVSFRVFTALKQFLSMPAYISDSNPMYLAANIANPIGAWRWSMKNLPLFEKRWSSRMAGDPRLLKSDMDWKMWRSRIVEIASRVGMSPNAFVDALTVAIGSHSMYQTKLAKYKRQGYAHDVAEARAKQDATILFNQTQQSSEGAFLSTMQVDRSWLSVLFTVFRNSSMSYTRQLYDSIRNLGHRFTPGYKGLSEEFMAKQMRRDGIDPDKADRNAKQEYRRGIIRDLVRVGVFGYVLQLAWNLGAYLPYLILGEDDEEKDKMWQDVWNHSMFGSIEGLTGGDVISAAGNMWVSGEGNPQYLTKDMPLASDVLSILKKMDKDQVSAMNDVINLLVQSTVGVNPQSLTDAVVAVMDYCGDDAETSRECALLMARVLNCPQSQLDKIYFDELDASGEEASQMTPSEIAERYARYKVRRGAPLTGWAYGNEQREKLMDKYRDRSNTLAKERLTRETDKQASQNMAQWLEEFEATKDRVKEIRKVKSRDEDRYDELLNELEITPEYDRYEIIKGYKRDVDALTKEWLNATTPAQRDSCAQAIIRLKSDMVRELINTQQ